jgi:hypothetical protein
MQGALAVLVSPSFNSYFSGKLVEIAARVVQELRQETNPDDDIFSWAAENPPPQSQEISNSGEEEDEDEFEFVVVCKELKYSSPISADEIFYNGQIRPLYLIFDQTLLLNDSYTNADHSRASKTSTHCCSPLKKLMVEEREQQEEAREPMSCSSSQADELDGVPPGTYYVWTPTKPSSAATDASPPPPPPPSSSKFFIFLIWPMGVAEPRPRPLGVAEPRPRPLGVAAPCPKMWWPATPCGQPPFFFLDLFLNFLLFCFFIYF